MVAIIILIALTLPIPTDSREFAHWSAPIIISEFGNEVTDLALSYAFPSMDKEKKAWLSLFGGCVVSVIAWRLNLVNRHYQTDREQQLLNWGFGEWASARIINIVIRKPLWRKERLRQATLEGR